MTKPEQRSLHEQLDQAAEVVGVARDAHAGAVVLTDDRTPVYIAGLESWDGGLSGARVRVSGVLRHRALVPEAQVAEDGSVSHGMSGKVYVVEGASWRTEA